MIRRIIDQALLLALLVAAVVIAAEHVPSWLTVANDWQKRMGDQTGAGAAPLTSPTTLPPVATRPRYN